MGQIFAVKVLHDSDIEFDHWLIDGIEVEKHEYQNDRIYVYFTYKTEDGESKLLTYSDYTDMFYGIEDNEITATDLEVLIKFISLRLYKSNEFRKKVNLTPYNTALESEYIYKEIL